MTKPNQPHRATGATTMSSYQISFSGIDMSFEEFSYMVRIEAASRISAMSEAYRRLYRNFDVANIASVEVVEE